MRSTTVPLASGQASSSARRCDRYVPAETVAPAASVVVEVWLTSASTITCEPLSELLMTVVVSATVC